MRQWNLTAIDPFSLRLAADCRLIKTDYADDQSWELTPGGAGDPAIGVQTYYGGRVGLARLIPMWTFPDRVIYKAAEYAEPYTIHEFAPNYAKASARITPTLAITFEIFIVASRVLAGRYTFHNSGTETIQFDAELVPQIARDGAAPVVRLIALSDGSEALALGALGNVYPVLLLDGADQSHTGQASLPKLISPVTVAPGATRQLKWLHAGYPTLEASVQEGTRWLGTDWDSTLALIEKLSEGIPTIETGDPGLDGVIAFSLHSVMRSFISGSGNLPYPWPVAVRIPQRGYGGKSGTNHPTDWQSQTIPLTWLVAPTVALFAPDLARGAIRNFLAARGSDGWIDWRVGPGSAPGRLLAMPLIAAAAWAVYEITEDKYFLSEIHTGLHEFFLRWFGRDMDRDSDGAPEWTTALQATQDESPVFNRFRRWSANAEISKAETPDLLAMLIHEGEALEKIDAVVGKRAPGTSPIGRKLDRLRTQLAALYQPDSATYAKRDRDTHVIRDDAPKTIYHGKGDEWLSTPVALDDPDRLLLRIMGGQNNAPRVTARVEGIAADGTPLSETLPLSAFTWYYGFGSALTEQAYAQVTFVKFEGLSRVFSTEVSTVTLTGQTLPDLLPLWAGAGADQRSKLVRRLSESYMRPAGLPQSVDERLQADNPNRQVSMFWNALMAEALIDGGYNSESRLLIEHLLKTELAALRTGHGFATSYHAETGVAQGDPDSLAGIFPVHLLLRWYGVRVVSARRVWVKHNPALPYAVTVTHHAIKLTITPDGITIIFPSGDQHTLAPADWQPVDDALAPIEPPPPVPAAEMQIPVTVAPSAPITIAIDQTADHDPEQNGAPAEPDPEPPPPTFRIKVRRVDN